ncbi:MAG: serine/threonine protein kinase [Acidobacteriia bacterium]|nr:serine/threonine protein kinase [Terriglobia bacterium]
MATGKRIGKYEIAEQIGVGGFGIVYKAWDPFIQRWVALKTCNASEPEATQRFFREAQLAGALQHPNITLIFDFGIEGQTPYFVQEFLSGTDLDEVMEARRPSLEGVLAILLQVCAGLDFAHSRGIVHRDIKPANVRVLEDGTVKIMDFGIAKSLEGESRLTQTGVALGTAGYLAPEQLSGKALDPRTDLFSLGVMAYEMVTGVRPFTGPNLSNVIYQILNQDPLPPRQRNAACPERLDRAILKALAKNPGDRYATVREFAHDLKEVLTALPRRSPQRGAETTTAMVREELARLSTLPREQLTAATQLAARPLDVLSTASVPPDGGRPRRRAIIVAGAVVALAAAASAWWFLVGPGATAASRGITTGDFKPTALAAFPTPVLSAVPTAVPTPASVEVELFVDPPADVTVDAQALGRVQSSQVSLTLGKHSFTQRIPGYREETQEIEVTQEGQKVALRLPPFGIISVLNDFNVPVHGTKVYLDDKMLGALPVRDRKVAAGSHEIKVTWPDGSEYREVTDVGAASSVTRVVRPQ